MKKLFFALSLLLLPLMASADAVEIDGIYYNLIEKAHVAEVTYAPEGLEYKGDLTIPAKIEYEGEEYDVATIAKQAFLGYRDLNTVKLPESIIKIEERAFERSGISNIEIPNSVTTINNSAFTGCDKLKSLKLSDNLTSLSEGLLWGCTSLEKIDIPKKITTIGKNAFSQCSGITYFEIPESVIEICDGAFTGCKGLSNIVIPNSVQKIGSGLFSSCTNLLSVSLPKDMTALPSALFSGCTSLASFAIPEGIESIGGSAFEGCTGLTTMDFPEGVTHIGFFAFKDCSNIQSINIPKSMVEISMAAFFECNKLTSVYISDLASWCNINFIDNPLGRVEHLYLNNDEVVDLVIPDGVEHINAYAFYNKPYITSARMPSSLYNINKGAFNGCINLQKLYLNDNLSFLGEEAFYGCSNLESLTLPNSLTNIGGNCFAGCVKIKKIRIPDNVTSIGHGAFAMCSKLDTLIIGSGINNIEYDAFSYCEQLKDVFLYSINPPSIYHPIFRDSRIDYATLHVPEDGIEIYKKWSYLNEFGNIIRLPEIVYVVDGELYAKQLVVIEMPIIPIIEPEKEGHTFSGWSDFPDTMPTEDIIISGTFTVNTYNLIYLIDGEEYKIYGVKYGTEIIIEEEPTKIGYTFSGWSNHPSLMPAHDVTIMGTFSINKYNLTYMIDGEEYKLVEVEYGATIIPEVEPTMEGYTFSGWSEIPETMPAHDLTVTGTFTINKYIVTYIIDGEVYMTEEVEYGAEINAPNPPVRDGYEFAWSDVPETMPANDITIYGTYTVGIESILSADLDVKIFTVSGKPLSKLQKGVNIIRMKDGKIKKIIVK